PGHQRTSWSVAKSLAVSLTISVISVSSMRMQKIDQVNHDHQGSHERDQARRLHPKASPIAASISAILKGCPETLFTGRASTRYWSRSRVLSCPLFISG